MRTGTRLLRGPGLAALATQVTAPQKRGFGLNEFGNLTIFNPAAEYAYRLGVDDQLKFFRNQKTYQDIEKQLKEKFAVILEELVKHKS